MVQFRNFTESDWFGFSGAERFDDGSPPKIALLDLSSHDAVVIHDRTGVTITWDVGDTTRGVDILAGAVTRCVGIDAAAIELLQATMTFDDLVDLPGYKNF